MTEEQMLIEEKDDIIVDQQGNIIEQTPQENVPSSEGQEDTSSEEHEDEKPHEEDESEEESAREGETPEEAEARRERNRQRRRENKERRKEYIESLRREIAARDELLQQAMQRLDAVERRTHGADIAAINSELQKAVDAYNYFKSQHAEAVSNANGQLATEAFEKMQAALNRAQQLDSIRKAAQRTQQPAPQPLDPRIKIYAEQWLERNSWYDPNGSDMDSKVALSVDQALHAEGWNPTTPQYWEELDSRLRKYLPHRYNSSYNKQQRNREQSRSVPVSSSGREAVQASGGYKLSAERVQALKDAGLWDDPKARAEAIKRFQEYDKQQGAR